jgi:hypothetical protein
MRKPKSWGPITTDHLSIEPHLRCAACHQPFQLGEDHTLIPLGPGANPESRAKARAGLAYPAAAAPVHWACATGEES